MTLQVTGGSLRGRRLKTPRGEGIRPTAARVREALFSILGGRLDGQRVLDLFAGAGTLGIEAGSRGASHVVFVEREKGHLALLRENARLLEGVAEYQVIGMDAKRAIGRLAEEQDPFDLVFLDPPYGKGLSSVSLEQLGKAGEQLLFREAVLVAETEGHEELPEQVGGWTAADKRSYGQTGLTFYRSTRNSQ